MKCELSSPIAYYSLLLPGEDPLEARDVYICDKCVKKDKWRKRFTDPKYFLAK